MYPAHSLHPDLAMQMASQRIAELRKQAERDQLAAYARAAGEHRTARHRIRSRRAGWARLRPAAVRGS
jgi:hypothetical protein